MVKIFRSSTLAKLDGLAKFGTRSQGEKEALNKLYMDELRGSPLAKQQQALFHNLLDNAAEELCELVQSYQSLNKADRQKLARQLLTLKTAMDEMQEDLAKRGRK